MNYQAYIDQLEALSIREQLLIGATCVAFLVSILQFFLIDPMLAGNQLLANDLKAQTTAIERQDQKLSGSRLTPTKNRLVTINAEIADIEQQLEAIEARVSAHTSLLISAQRMPALLKTLLNKEKVTLVSLLNMPPVPLLVEAMPDPTATTDVPDVELYAHEIQIELRGDFHSLRRYLLAIEQQPWQLMWQGIRLKSEASGESLMQLQIQTLSTDNAWLGV